MVFSPKLVMSLLVFCYALWGGGMIAMKYAFESFAVLHVVFARVAFAALFYLALLPKWRHLPYEKGDIVLLCSDGLTNMLEDEEIRMIISGARDIVEMAQELVKAANERGGRDNISVILVESA